MYSKIASAENTIKRLGLSTENLLVIIWLYIQSLQKHVFENRQGGVRII